MMNGFKVARIISLTNEGPKHISASTSLDKQQASPLQIENEEQYNYNRYSIMKKYHMKEYQHVWIIRPPFSPGLPTATAMGLTSIWIQQLPCTCCNER